MYEKQIPWMQSKAGVFCTTNSIQLQMGFVVQRDDATAQPAGRNANGRSNDESNAHSDSQATYLGKYK